MIEAPRNETNSPWWPKYIAEHEACHAVVAMKMGLPVEWVTVEAGFDEGIHFPAAVKIPDDKIDRERDLLAICVATAAPSHIITHIHVAPSLYHYAHLEAQGAYKMAEAAGIEFDEVYDLSVNAVDEHWVEIIELAERLEAEGKVVFDVADEH